MPDERTLGFLRLGDMYARIFCLRASECPVFILALIRHAARAGVFPLGFGLGRGRSMAHPTRGLRFSKRRFVKATCDAIVTNSQRLSVSLYNMLEAPFVLG